MSVCFTFSLSCLPAVWLPGPPIPGPRPLMMPLASGSSIFKQSGEQRAVFSRLPAHVAQIVITFTSLGLPNSSFYSYTEIGTTVLFWGCQLLVYFCQIEGVDQLLLNYCKARSHTVPESSKAVSRVFRTLRSEACGCAAEASQTFLQVKT